MAASIVTLLCSLLLFALPSLALTTGPREYLLSTDFKITDKPKVRKYTFVARSVTCAPDGFKKKCLVINDQLSGPLIEANSHDTIEIKVINHLGGQDLTIHSHGLHQDGTNWEDGVYGITQCGIKAGGTQTYRIPLHGQSGTFYWHSHAHDTLIDGLSGPLIIHDPKGPIQRGRDYDRDLVYMLADWYHNTSATILAGLENTRGYNGRPVSAAPNSALLSGVGQYQCGDPDKDTPDKCTPSNKMLSYDVPRDTKLRVRLINTGGHATFRWSLDEHKVKIIEADATAVKPLPVERVTISPGQRYSALVHLKNRDAGKSFYVRSTIVPDCMASVAPFYNPSVLGTIRVGKGAKGLPQSKDWPADTPGMQNCDDPEMVPIVKFNVPKKAFKRHRFNTTIYPNPVTGSPFAPLVPGDVRKLYVDGVTAETFPEHPILHELAPPGKGVLRPMHVANATFHHRNDWYDLILINPTTLPAKPHPWHLHSLDMHIVAQGLIPADPAELSDEYFDKLEYKFKNPMRRDTVHVAGAGWMVVRVKADIAGVFYLHCHVGWHLGVGMAAVVISLPEEIERFKIPKANLQLCEGRHRGESGGAEAGRMARRSVRFVERESRVVGASA